ncbi:hypothetical protein RA276_26790, partial [Pseudomonas syringae pv. tagetis]|uniref:hypothetical protein n=1 Tax=Pseudomonas syringae group genomosp. 7 TaxID=251699 RepID=UPI00376FDABF
AVEHLGQFSVGRRASTGSVFGQRQQSVEIDTEMTLVMPGIMSFLPTELAGSLKAICLKGHKISPVFAPGAQWHTG